MLGLQSQLAQREKELDAAKTQVTDLTRMLSTWQVSKCVGWDCFGGVVLFRFMLGGAVCV